MYVYVYVWSCTMYYFNDSGCKMPYIVPLGNVIHRFLFLTICGCNYENPTEYKQLFCTRNLIFCLHEKENETIFLFVAFFILGGTKTPVI